MQLIHRIRDTFIPKISSAAAEWAEESDRLAEKLAIQRRWMQKRGIDITLKESERPPRPQKKPPLPGTVIFFSSKS